MSVEQNWLRLHDWCLREAPITAAAIDPPAGQSVMDEIEASTDRKWPTELRTWFGLQNGNPGGRHSALIFPEYQPLPLDRVASVWASMTAIWADTTEAVGGLSLLDEPAGEVSGTYLSAYIPIACNSRRSFVRRYPSRRIQWMRTRIHGRRQRSGAELAINRRAPGGGCGFTRARTPMSRLGSDHRRGLAALGIPLGLRDISPDVVSATTD